MHADPRNLLEMTYNVREHIVCSIGGYPVRRSITQVVGEARSFGQDRIIEVEAYE